MKLLLFSIIILLNNYTSRDNKLYICDYASKIYGQTPIVFAETIDTVAVITSYKIYFTKDKIIKVKKHIDSFKYKFQKKGDEKILVLGLKMSAYTSKEFKNHKFNSDKLYIMLHPNFWNMSNEQRLELMEKLSKK